MKVVCRTNLVLKNEEWPTELPILPQIGSKIRSSTEWPSGFQLELRVVDVTLKRRKKDELNYGDETREWYAEIELHIANQDIADFYNWYAQGTHKQ